MTNYYSKKITCFFLLTLLVVLGSLGCSSMSWQKRTVFSYDAAGEVLKASKAILKGMCIDGTLNAEDCAAAKKAYNDAVGIYKLLGTTAILAIDTGDPGSYNQMQAQLMELLTQIADFTGRR